MRVRTGGGDRSRGRGVRPQELRWYKPVRPDDELRIRVRILEASRSRSKPDRGMVRTLVEVLNQSEEVVMSLKAMNILRCRGAA